MPKLIALDIPLSRNFADAVARTWDSGDAVFPIDQRWPAAMRDKIMAEIRPTHMMSSDGSVNRFDVGAPTEEGDALVIATSGSTGTPKGVVHTHAGMMASAVACHERIGSDNAHWLACLPPAHIGGFAVIARSILLGLPLTVTESPTAENLLAANIEGANYVSLVPTMLERIEPSMFDVILLGGSKPPANRPPNAIATYGSTETGSGVAYEGRPLKNVEIRVDDAGAIFVRGPMLMRSYRDGTCQLDASTWFDTGDAGTLHADGKISVNGRRSEMIISGGENIWPDAVENVLGSHPLVSQCAVFGFDDPKWGQRVCAMVVTTQPVTPDELREFVGGQLPKYCAPQSFKFVDALPLTAGGKVDRRALSL